QHLDFNLFIGDPLALFRRASQARPDPVVQGGAAAVFRRQSAHQQGLLKLVQVGPTGYRPLFWPVFLNLRDFVFIWKLARNRFQQINGRNQALDLSRVVVDQDELAARAAKHVDQINGLGGFLYINRRMQMIGVDGSPLGQVAQQLL